MLDTALEPLLSLKQAAQMLGLAEVTVRKMVRQGKLGGVHLGRRLLFEPETLRNFIARNRTAPFLGHTVDRVEPHQAAIPQSAQRLHPFDDAGHTVTARRDDAPTSCGAERGSE